MARSIGSVERFLFFFVIRRFYDCNDVPARTAIDNFSRAPHAASDELCTIIDFKAAFARNGLETTDGKSSARIVRKVIYLPFVAGRTALLEGTIT